MRIENRDQDTQYFFPENLKDIKKLVKMAKEVNSYNKVLKQYLKVYKNEYLETIEYLTNKDENYLDYDLSRYQVKKFLLNAFKDIEVLNEILIEDARNVYNQLND